MRRGHERDVYECSDSATGDKLMEDLKDKLLITNSAQLIHFTFVFSMCRIHFVHV